MSVCVGHRRKLLDAIAALRTDASAKTAPADALPTIDSDPSDDCRAPSSHGDVL